MGDLEAAAVEQSSAANAPAAIRYGVVALLSAVVGLVVWAATQDYALRVTSDTPTFLTLVNDMGERPLEPQSPFLPHSDVETPHATPYMQAIALLWRFLEGGTDPIAIARFLTLVGIGVFAFALLAVFLYTRRLAGATAAWLSMPVLLLLFGPAHVIWASDLTFHGAMYGSFYPQNLAIGLSLLTLLLLGARSHAAIALAPLLVATTMLVHPFTGILLSVLAAVEGVRLALRTGWNVVRVPIALAGGFALALLWPAYSVDAAFTQTGVRGVVLVALCSALPLGVRLASLRLSRPRLIETAKRLCAAIASRRAAFALALVGVVATAALAVWQWALVADPSTASTRLSIYWVDDRWRWPLLLAAGSAGIAGLAALARRGRLVPLVWLAGCFTIGAVGAAGVSLPLWYRFVLFCQVPLAIGVAVVLAQRRTRTVLAIGAALAIAVVVKVASLVALPTDVTYLGSPLQSVWSLGEHVPRAPGIVATDPATAYFIPAATGHRVLTVDKGHVGSPRELTAAAEGYDLLRRYYAGGADWWDAGKEMWRRGVRYVVIQKQTTLEPRALADFTWRNARLETDAQRRALGNYFYENNRVGTLIHDSPEYAIYQLDRNRLFAPEELR